MLRPYVHENTRSRPIAEVKHETVHRRSSGPWPPRQRMTEPQATTPSSSIRSYTSASFSSISASTAASAKLPPNVNRILFVRNLPYKITADEMYDLFGKYGAIKQIRVGTEKETKGTAFVVYEDIFDAKNACEHLSGFSLQGRYLIVLYYQPDREAKKRELERQQRDLEEIKAKMGQIEK